MTRSLKLHNLERRLRYEVKAAQHAHSPNEREQHVLRYMKYDRRYTNLQGRHYVPREERA